MLYWRLSVPQLQAEINKLTSDLDGYARFGIDARWYVQPRIKRLAAEIADRQRPAYPDDDSRSDTDY